jgi:hypothetical protein
MYFSAPITARESVARRRRRGSCFDADVTLGPFAAGHGRSHLRFVVMNAGERSRFHCEPARVVAMPSGG